MYIEANIHRHMYVFMYAPVCGLRTKRETDMRAEAPTVGGRNVNTENRSELLLTLYSLFF